MGRDDAGYPPPIHDEHGMVVLEYPYYRLDIGVPRDGGKTRLHVVPDLVARCPVRCPVVDGVQDGRLRYAPDRGVALEDRDLGYPVLFHDVGRTRDGVVDANAYGPGCA